MDERATRLREQLAAAGRDPELQRLLGEWQECQETYAGYKGAPGQHQRMAKLMSLLSSYYAGHYPDAGVDWMLSLPAELRTWSYFISELCRRADSDTAFRLLDSVPVAKDRAAYLEALCKTVKGADIERAWPLILDPAFPGEDTFRMKLGLIGGQAGTDPDGAWETYKKQMGPGSDGEFFFSSFRDLNPADGYPVRLLDRVSDVKGQASGVYFAIRDCRTQENIAPVMEWLAARPPDPQYDSSYVAMAAWNAAYGQAADLERWIERIQDRDTRENIVREVARALKKRKIGEAGDR